MRLLSLSVLLPPVFPSSLQIESNSRASLLDASRPLRYLSRYLPANFSPFGYIFQADSAALLVYGDRRFAESRTRDRLRLDDAFEFVTPRVNIRVIVRHEKCKTKIDVAAMSARLGEILAG